MAIASGTGLIIFFVVVFPKWQVESLLKKKGNKNQSDFDLEKERIKLEDDARKTVAQIIGGILFLIGLVFTYQTLELNHKSQELTRETIEISREGQLTDRFAKAIELLGNQDRSVRLGGLYALERISKDSPKDQPVVIETIAAYIREKSLENLKVSEYETTSYDISAAFDIIKRRNTANDSKPFTLDLSRADLRGINLQEMNLSYSNLNYANLRFSIMMNTNLTGASLHNAIFENSNMIGANFEQADVSGAKFAGALLFQTNMNTMVKAGGQLKYPFPVNTLRYNQLTESIIDSNTVLPAELQSRKATLIELSRENYLKYKWNDAFPLVK